MTGYLDNPGPETLTAVPTVFALEVYGAFWFWPGWVSYDPPQSREFDYDLRDINMGSSRVYVVPEFTWPETTGSLTGLRFYGALLNSEMSRILGQMAMVEWGYGG